MSRSWASAARCCSSSAIVGLVLGDLRLDGVVLLGGGLELRLGVVRRGLRGFEVGAGLDHRRVGVDEARLRARVPAPGQRPPAPSARPRPSANASRRTDPSPPTPPHHPGELREDPPPSLHTSHTAPRRTRGPLPSAGVRWARRPVGIRSGPSEGVRPGCRSSVASRTAVAGLSDDPAELAGAVVAGLADGRPELAGEGAAGVPERAVPERRGAWARPRLAGGCGGDLRATRRSSSCGPPARPCRARPPRGSRWRGRRRARARAGSRPGPRPRRSRGRGGDAGRSRATRRARRRSATTTGGAAPPMPTSTAVCWPVRAPSTRRRPPRSISASWCAQNGTVPAGARSCWPAMRAAYGPGRRPPVASARWTRRGRATSPPACDPRPSTSWRGGACPRRGPSRWAAAPERPVAPRRGTLAHRR